ncbi:TPA: hypothetical protein EYO12_02645 [Candidatus Saccharibacteria bacterium]|nr:hypothetical protein [Candidatus Saccharibacteria bacterium]HIO88062.1 hypothetical protein [Candidatus Saccharibacteria bacterium]
MENLKKTTATLVAAGAILGAGCSEPASNTKDIQQIHTALHASGELNATLKDRQCEDLSGAYTANNQTEYYFRSVTPSAITELGMLASTITLVTEQMPDTFDPITFSEIEEFVTSNSTSTDLGDGTFYQCTDTYYGATIEDITIGYND